MISHSLTSLSDLFEARLEVRIDLLDKEPGLLQVTLVHVVLLAQHIVELVEVNSTVLVRVGELDELSQVCFGNFNIKGSEGTL